MTELRVRMLHEGMGQAVAERTVLRKKADGTFEDWGEVAHRVATGNTLLGGRALGWTEDSVGTEYHLMKNLIASGALMMSGRHLQHGDSDQPNRNIELFTNCATAPTTFLLFLDLLNGSGVGRCYDDDMMLVNWDDMPTVWCVLDEDHPDYDRSQHLSARNARHMFNGSKDMLWHEVGDSREGWGKALELVEVAAFERVHRDKLLVLDFSGVRCKGTPIKGMQGRPSSGPVPVMNALSKLSMIRGAGLPRWKQAMYVDHFFAECVLVGGARRAARKSDKRWKDRNILDFIKIKRPVEYDGKTMEEVVAYRRALAEEGKPNPLPFLWSSNNSVLVDAEFWKDHARPGTWANEVFRTAMECAYADGTGEPGFTNADLLEQNDEGWDDLYRGDYVGSRSFQPDDNTHVYLAKLAKRAEAKGLHMITNPCGEITLNVLGGYCVLAAVAPYHCEPETDKYHVMNAGVQCELWWCNELVKEWDDRFEEAVRAATRAAMRVNLMDAIYGREVERTNRIGVGLIGIHEWMWARFGLSFREALDTARGSTRRTRPPGHSPMARKMWNTLARMSLAVKDEAEGYAKQLGVVVPHTMTTIPPGGTISKLFGLTEGCHLPPMAEYVRWVQFRNDDPLVQDYAARGYPTRVLEQYEGHTIVGFPTQPVLAGMMPRDKMVLAPEATIEEQYAWIKLLETYWITGLGEVPGNQVSYTLKYDPKWVSYEQFTRAVTMNQAGVRTCSVMPTEDVAAYEYLPEQPVSQEEYQAIVSRIERVAEEVGREHLDCEGGACPVEFGTKGEARLEGMGAG